MILRSTLACSLAMAALAAGAVPDRTSTPKELIGVGIDQHLNAQVPLGATFRDESGATVRIGDLLGRRPAILAPVYYRCTMLCSYILNAVVAGLRPLSLRPGRDFDVIAISIDPSEDSQLAAGKREHYARSYSSKAGTAGWHFLTGDNANIHAVTDAIGFHYRYDATSKLFLHASGIMLLTPQGRVARYLYGVEYTPKDLKLGLIEASSNRIGSPADQILLFCYHYNPLTGKYGPAVVNLLRALAGLVLLALVVSLTILWRRDIRADRKVMSQGAQP